MNPRCKKCGKELDKSNAYKVVVKNKNTYYCSETEYRLVQSRQATKEKIYQLLDDIAEIPKGSIINREIAQWEQIADYNLLISYLQENKTFLSNIMMRKNFNNEYARIRYFSAIIKNNISTYKPIEEFKRKTEIEIYETKYRPQKRHKCLNDYKEGE